MDARRRTVLTVLAKLAAVIVVVAGIVISGVLVFREEAPPPQQQWDDSVAAYVGAETIAEAEVEEVVADLRQAREQSYQERLEELPDDADPAERAALQAQLDGLEERLAFDHERVIEMQILTEAGTRYAAQAGLTVVPSKANELIELGDQVKRAVMAAVQIEHPLVPELNTLYGTIIDGAPRDPANHQANICVFAEREVDRSPTGTGTSGRVAQLLARGRLQLGEEFRNESIVGSVFTGKAVSLTRVGEFDAVIPEVSGSAHILGFNQWVMQQGDELGAGFLVR